MECKFLKSCNLLEILEPRGEFGPNPLLDTRPKGGGTDKLCWLARTFSWGAYTGGASTWICGKFIWPLYLELGGWIAPLPLLLGCW